jgi:propanediol dehydratase small subunit
MSLILVLILAALAWLAFHDWQLPNSLRYRPFQGRAWRNTFPSASRKDIREFLSLCGAAFSCRDCDRVHLRPDDQVLGVVRAARPSRWLPEASDVEPLARALRERYGLLLDDVWHDGLTLGGLFQRVQQQRGKPAL